MTTTEGLIEKNIGFESGEISLEGTLTLPKNVKEPSVVLLLPGSGPTDRDENAGKGLYKFISNNMKTISFNLANNGYASYRYDKRGVGKTRGLALQVGFNDIVNDARSAVNFLSNLKEIDSNNIFVLGHSEGGIVGTILSAENKNIKGFIGIASPITPLDEEVVRQIKHIFTMRGKSKEKVDQLTNSFKETFDLMRKYRDWGKIDDDTIKQIFSKV
jgi:pimeloyl-ACP methyl ester carboxylesterase